MWCGGLGSRYLRYALAAPALYSICPRQSIKSLYAKLQPIAIAYRFTSFLRHRNTNSVLVVTLFINDIIITRQVAANSVTSLLSPHLTTKPSTT